MIMYSDAISETHCHPRGTKGSFGALAIRTLLIAVVAVCPSLAAHELHHSPLHQDFAQDAPPSRVLDSLVKVSHQDYLLAFEFDSSSERQKEDIQYAYKLEGFDTNWGNTTGSEPLIYSNLDAKHYLFRLKASNQQGEFGMEETQVAVHVLPSPWHTWWAYMLYLIAGGILLAMIIRAYVGKLNRATRYRALLEEKVRIRTAELEKANQQLLNASVTDQMTGLHNRRYVYNIIESQCAHIEREVKKAVAKGLNEQNIPRLYCLMFDLDGFKPVNDTYGHDAGDQIICQVSELLKTLCRKSDTVIRWGGDEFLIMGQVEHVDEINVLSERIRAAMVNYSFEIGMAQKLQLSCSMGYCLYPFSVHYQDAVSWEQVQVIADRAMYHSKGAGKDHWTGIISTYKRPPSSLACDLVTRLEEVIDDGVVEILESSFNNNNQQARVVLHESRHAKAC